MDTPIWDLDFEYHGTQSVKVSCHAGDFGSRVLCNIIGDQPLFYIEDSAEEEFLLNEELVETDPTMFPTDEEFLSKMRAKLESYEKTAKSLETYKITLPEEEFDAVFNTSKNEKLSLENIIEYGHKSAIFKSYHDIINQYDIAIKLSNKVETSIYDREKHVIAVNPNLDLLTATSATLKSMRTAWHHKNGVLINPLSFQPEEAIIINRLLEADLDITKISYLWDLKLAGEDHIWTSAMNGVDYDLCSAYAMEAMTDFRSIKGGLAARATFEKWFLSSRCKIFDRQIIQTMMGGHTDINFGSEDASRVIAMDVIAGLGHRPDAQNYLSPIVVQIMNDALYGEVRDRSNANFLWFVRFERKMSEMEQELQDGESETISQESKDNVVLLPNHAKDMPDAKPSADGMASVFFIDHFRAG